MHLVFSYRSQHDHYPLSSTQCPPAANPYCFLPILKEQALLALVHNMYVYHFSLLIPPYILWVATSDRCHGISFSFLFSCALSLPLPPLLLHSFLTYSKCLLLPLQRVQLLLLMARKHAMKRNSIAITAGILQFENDPSY